MSATLRSFKSTVLVVAMASALVVGVTRPSAAQSVDAAGASGGGIKVHGHWTIVVSDPDGTVVSRHEIQNSLANSGRLILPRLLARTATAGAWLISIGTDPLCHPGASGFLECTIGSTGMAADSTNLTATVPTTGPNAGKLVLRGSVRAPSAMTVSAVSTYLFSCAPATSPAACTSGFTNSSFFSGKAATVTSVVASQVIDVTVVISFTS